MRTGLSPQREGLPELDTDDELGHRAPACGQQEGVAILFIEQHVERALELAHRGFVLESGRTVLEGRSTELLRFTRGPQVSLSS